MLSLIVAIDRNRAIGKDGDIPWHAPEDLKFFQRETTGGALVMGRRTWESLPVKPLPKRFNSVVTRSAVPADHVGHDPAQAVQACYAAGYHRVYGIGGAGIYNALLPFADRLLLTDVDLEVAGADTHFPPVDLSEWHLVHSRQLRAESPACMVRELIRKR